jgi:hypothetical protein
MVGQLAALFFVLIVAWESAQGRQAWAPCALTINPVVWEPPGVEMP